MIVPNSHVKGREKEQREAKYLFPKYIMILPSTQSKKIKSSLVHIIIDLK